MRPSNIQWGWGMLISLVQACTPLLTPPIQFGQRLYPLEVVNKHQQHPPLQLRHDPRARELRLCQMRFNYVHLCIIVVISVSEAPRR